MQALLNAITTMDMPLDAQRIFHGRGGLHPGCEHLALDDMERALDEAGRLARRAVILSFFNMSDIPDHRVRPKGAYHWNRLSRTRVEAQLRRRLPSVTATPIATWLAERYDYPHSYNRHAWTIVAERPIG